MHIILFLICWFISIFFFMISHKIKRNWVQKTFKLYGILFSITSVVVMTIFLIDHKATIESAFASFFPKTSTVQPKKTEVSQHSIEGSIQLDAPLVEQLPELPRGCEVTSLAMLLQYNHVDVDKMELAKKVKRNPSQYQVKDNVIHFGNPYNGFVGDMYSFNRPGLGVYHGPIAELASEYVGDRVYDLTGESFSKIIAQLNQGRPVWVIINGAYKKLPKEAFVTWHTEDGPMEITMREHSVLITGYDHKFIYFNDPLNVDSKAPIDDFKAAWIQMGKQAITVK